MPFEEWMGEYPRMCVPWSEDEERVLLENFKAGATVKELCTLHGRKEGGITSRLEKLLDFSFYNIPLQRQQYMYTAKDLAAKGYRCVSRKYNTLARVDRSDWLSVLAKQMNLAVADYYNPSGKLSSHWCDHYRRCVSKDKVVVSPEVCKQIPGSSGDECGFVLIR